MGAPILAATGVRKVYRTGTVEVEALRGVDLTVAAGELVTVMGPSGNGKTTLLNCLSGLDDIDEGTFRRLALRNIARRRGEALLVVLGSLLGTAIITSSFIVGDTLEASIRDSARTQYGPVDVVVEVPDAAALPEVAEAALAEPLTADLLANGVEARTFRSEIEEQLSQQSDFFRLFQGFLASAW